jgi:hypothetical protein
VTSALTSSEVVSISSNRDQLGNLRRYKTRFLLVVIAVVGGFACATAEYLERDHVELPGIVEWFPLLAVGESLVAAAVIGWVYEWQVRREAEESIMSMFAAGLREQTRTLNQSFGLSLLSDPAALSAFTQDEIRRILGGAVDAYVGDPDVGNEVKQSIMPHLGSQKPPWRSLVSELQLSADSSGLPGAEEYMDARLVCEYRAILSEENYSVRIDAGSQRVYGSIDLSAAADFLMSVGSTQLYDWSEEAATRVERLTVDGVDVNLMRSVLMDDMGRPVEVTWSGAVPKTQNERVARRVHVEVSYKLPKRGHYFTYPVIENTVGFEFIVRARGQLGLRRKRLLPAIQFGGPVVPEYVESGDTFTARVATDRCVFAGSAVTFVWNLDSEFASVAPSTG